MSMPSHLPPSTILSITLFLQRGTPVESRGYWGDIVNGPYFAFGLTCRDAELLTKRDDKYIHSSGQVSVQHMKELVIGHDAVMGAVQSIEAPSEPTQTSDAASAPKEDEEEEKEKQSGKDATPKTDNPPANKSNSSNTPADSKTEEKKSEPDTIPIDALPTLTTVFHDTPYRISVFPVLGQFPQPLRIKSKFAHFFDIVCLDSTAARSFDDVLHFLRHQDTSSPSSSSPSYHSSLIIETPKYLLDLKPETKCAFVEKMASDARTAGFVPSCPLPLSELRRKNQAGDIIFEDANVPTSLHFAI